MKKVKMLLLLSGEPIHNGMTLFSLSRKAVAVNNDIFSLYF